MLALLFCGCFLCESVNIKVENQLKYGKTYAFVFYLKCIVLHSGFSTRYMNSDGQYV